MTGTVTNVVVANEDEHVTAPRPLKREKKEKINKKYEL